MWKDSERNKGCYTYKEETFVEHMVEIFYEDFLYSCALTDSQMGRFDTIEEYVKIARRNQNTDVESMLEYFDCYEWKVEIWSEITEILRYNHFYVKGNKPNFNRNEAMELADKTLKKIISNIKELIRKDFKNGKSAKIDKNDYDFIRVIKNKYHVGVKLFGEHPFNDEKEKWINERNIKWNLEEGLRILGEHIVQDIARHKKEGLCVFYEDHHDMHRGYWFILED